MAHRLQPIVRVLDRQPLSILFGIHNPAAADGARRLPVMLGPLGYFVRMRVLDRQGARVWETEEPKIALKLDPSEPAGYRDLDPGYLHGIVFDLPEVDLGADPRYLDVDYSNRQFSGPQRDPIGELGFRLRIELPPA